jgi:hypothetical protein
MQVGNRANSLQSAVPSKNAAVTSKVAMKYPLAVHTWHTMLVTMLFVVGA